MFLLEFSEDLNNTKKVKTQKQKTEKKINKCDTASQLYIFLEVYYDEYNELSDDKRNKMDPQYKPEELFLEEYNYEGWYENEESSDTTKTDETSTDLPQMPTLEGDEEEVKEGKGLQILTTFPILLAQIKAGNNSYKLKNEIRQILHLLYQHNKITKNVSNNLIKLL